MFGDGQQTRDFTFVADAVAANLAAAERGRAGAVYNIGGGARVTVEQCLEILVRLVGEGVVRTEGRQDGDVTHTYADTTLAQRELQFEPRVELAQGLERQVAWQQQLAERAAAPGVC